MGVPGKGNGHRTISLLTFRMEKENMLYIRVQDKDEGLVYTTNQLGRVLIANDPQIMLDKNKESMCCKWSGRLLTFIPASAWTVSGWDSWVIRLSELEAFLEKDTRRGHYCRRRNGSMSR